MARKTTKKATKVVDGTMTRGTATVDKGGLSEDFREIYTCTADDGTEFTFETNRRRWLLRLGDSVLKGDVDTTTEAKSCIVVDCRYRADGYPKQIIFAYYPGGEFILDRPQWFE